MARSNFNFRRGSTARSTLVAFSLIEVVIAVGIFALSVTVVLALLPELMRHAASSNDTLAALQLPDAIRTELKRMAVAGGLEVLAGKTRPMAVPLSATCRLAATRDAARVQSLDYQVPPLPVQIAEDQRYFLIEAWSFADPPLAFDPSGNGLALQVRISWPYHLPGSAQETPAASREGVGFNLVLNR